MITTDNPTFNALLDEMLTGEARRLMLVGCGQGPEPAAVGVTPDHLAFLETMATEKRRILDNYEKAITLTRVAIQLGVQKIEEI